MLVNVFFAFAEFLFLLTGCRRHFGTSNSRKIVNLMAETSWPNYYENGRQFSDTFARVYVLANYRGRRTNIQRIHYRFTLSNFRKNEKFRLFNGEEINKSPSKFRTLPYFFFHSTFCYQTEINQCRLIIETKIPETFFIKLSYFNIVWKIELESPSKFRS